MAQTDQQRQDGLVISTIVMTTISVVLVITRCVLRFIIIKNPGLDDGAMIIATVGPIPLVRTKDNHGTSVSANARVAAGGGIHGSDSRGERQPHRLPSTHIVRFEQDDSASSDIRY